MNKRKMCFGVFVVLMILSQNLFAMDLETKIKDEIYKFITLQHEVRRSGESRLDPEQMAESYDNEYEFKNTDTKFIYKTELFNDALNKHELDLLMNRRFISYEEKLYDFKITKHSDFIEVIFFEDYIVRYDNTHRIVNTEGRKIKNYIKLEKHRGAWKISEHIVYKFVSVQDPNEVRQKADPKTILKIRQNMQQVFPQLKTKKYNIFRPVKKYQVEQIE